MEPEILCSNDEKDPAITSNGRPRTAAEKDVAKGNALQGDRGGGLVGGHRDRVGPPGRSGFQKRLPDVGQPSRAAVPELAPLLALGAVAAAALGAVGEDGTVVTHLEGLVLELVRWQVVLARGGDDVESAARARVGGLLAGGLAGVHGLGAASCSGGSRQH